MLRSLSSSLEALNANVKAVEAFFFSFLFLPLGFGTSGRLRNVTLRSPGGFLSRKNWGVCLLSVAGSFWQRQRNSAQDLQTGRQIVSTFQFSSYTSRVGSASYIFVLYTFCCTVTVLFCSVCQPMVSLWSTLADPEASMISNVSSGRLQLVQQGSRGISGACERVSIL